MGKPWSGIVKVQRELTTGHEDDTVLIYNRNKTIYYHGPMHVSLSSMLGERAKAYYFAMLGVDGIIDIKGRVKPRRW